MSKTKYPELTLTAEIKAGFEGVSVEVHGGVSDSTHPDKLDDKDHVKLAVAMMTSKVATTLLTDILEVYGHSVSEAVEYAVTETESMMQDFERSGEDRYSYDDVVEACTENARQLFLTKVFLNNNDGEEGDEPTADD